MGSNEGVAVRGGRWRSLRPCQVFWRNLVRPEFEEVLSAGGRCR
ncbi:hypothetical protein HNR30_005750 [Nonomuraea soli]|uniref:Uncharacterized protein n=1 Tax=Nonomuraea soli TaxID=1032476 RepID=A0A7W0CNL1_9ACTN|nr:hypothetical protein [Nonomuraea soli]